MYYISFHTRHPGQLALGLAKYSHLLVFFQVPMTKSFPCDRDTMSPLGHTCPLSYSCLDSKANLKVGNESQSEICS